MMTITSKIQIAILGATGSVGQKFVELLANHPWFEISELCASDKSVGKKYKDAVDWFLPHLFLKVLGKSLSKNVNLH
jgi:aspartate-semialdehyde dehydrogenase